MPKTDHANSGRRARSQYPPAAHEAVAIYSMSPPSASGSAGSVCACERARARACTCTCALAAPSGRAQRRRRRRAPAAAAAATPPPPSPPSAQHPPHVSPPPGRAPLSRSRQRAAVPFSSSCAGSTVLACAAGCRFGLSENGESERERAREETKQPLEALAVAWGRFASRAIPEVTRRLQQTRARWPEAAARTPLHWRHLLPSPDHEPCPTGCPARRQKCGKQRLSSGGATPP